MTGQVPTTDEVFELKALLEEDWPAMRAALHAAGVPLNEGESDGGGEGEGAATGTAGAAAETPPWGDDFDAERAWKLVENQRADLAKAKSQRDDFKKKAKEYEDATKSETDKAAERATEAEARATKAEAELARTNVALAKGLTPAQAKRLVGSTEEELMADADELLETFKKDGDDGGQGPARRPKEKLRSGAATDSSDDDDEDDPIKLAAKIRRPFS